MKVIHDPFLLSVNELQRLLDTKEPWLPEMERARRDPSGFHRSAAVLKTLENCQSVLDGVEFIPQTTYTHFRLFNGLGDRKKYEANYFLKRARMGSASLRLFFGEENYKDSVQDYLWSICEETNWVLPAHESLVIDLFSAETAFTLAETLYLLGGRLDAEVRSRVRSEVERRVFAPYLINHASFGWWKGENNWNGVCNSSVAAAFLLMEPEPYRAAQALSIALAGLKIYFEKAFESDGASTEGIGYWSYGLINFVALSEMLRARTSGAINLMDSDHFQKIASYPAKMLLSGSSFASFSDCPDIVTFNLGILTRMAEMTGDPSLLALRADTKAEEQEFRLPMLLRSAFWWDGQYGQAEAAGDAFLPVGAVVRFITHTPKSTPVILAVKAGHNAENHNQNDVGSFIVHVDEETFLTDPGRGLYTRQYFGPERYENIFANSYGHSVPRIGGKMQEAGRQYEGKIMELEMTGPVKKVVLDISRAYALNEQAIIRRFLTLGTDGVLDLRDEFYFGPADLEVEEALLTWLQVEVDRSSVLIRGLKHVLRLEIQSPIGAVWRVERLEDACRENGKAQVLKRLTFNLPAAVESHASIHMKVLPL